MHQLFRGPDTKSRAIVPPALPDVLDRHQENAQRPAPQRHQNTCPPSATASGQVFNTIETAKLLACGGVAGAVSKTATAPLARLTILYQVSGLHGHAGVHAPHKRTVAANLRHIVQQEGVRALWKSNGVTLIHRLPYSAMNFWAYERITAAWLRRYPKQDARSDVLRRLCAGGLAGMSACCLAYPFDLVRTRLAAQTTSHYYTGIRHAFSTIVKDEGVAGLYRGLGATLAQVGPSLALNYCTYETLRSHWTQQTGEKHPSVPASLACGSLAGIVSSTATFPLDLVRRRMQLQGQAGALRQYKGYADAFGSILRREGLRGLYRGLLPEWAKVIPGVSIAFCSYELAKKANVDKR